MFSCHRVGWHLVLGFVVLSSGLTASAQAPKTFKDFKDKIPEEFSDKKYMKEHTDLLKQFQSLNAISATPSGEETKKIERYFKWYLFLDMTSLDKLSDLANRRMAFVKDVSILKCPPVRKQVLELSLQMLPRFARLDDIHPAVRYNFILAVGELNAAESESVGATRKPPVPYPPALDVLLTELNSDKQIDGVRLAALFGIKRHAELTKSIPAGSPGAWTDDTRNKVISAMLAILAGKDVGAKDRTPEGQVWVQRRALDVLTEIGVEGNGVAQAIVTILQDEKAPLSLRLTAAQTLGTFQFKNNNKPPIAASEVAAALGNLAVQACRREAQRIEDEVKRAKEEAKLTGTGGSSTSQTQGTIGGPNSGGTSDVSAQDKYKIDAVKRRLKYELQAVLFGLRGPYSGKPRTIPGAPAPPETTYGVSALASTDEKKSVSELIEATKDVLASTDFGKAVRYEKIPSDVIRPMSKELSEAIGRLGPGKPKAAPAKKPAQPEKPAQPAPAELDPLGN